MASTKSVLVGSFRVLGSRLRSHGWHRASSVHWKSLPPVLDAWKAAFPVEPPAFRALGVGGSDPLLVPAELQVDVIAHVPPRDVR
jgi:hypothetical protein